MSHKRRAPKLFAYVLAVPFLMVVYLAAFIGKIARVSRPALKPVFGTSVISRIYTGEKFKRPPRRQPIPAAIAVGLAMVLIAPAVTTPPVAAAADPAQEVVDIAMSLIGSPYVFGADGPNKFDCSGLVYWVFKEAGELPRIGGSRMGARSYLRWFMARGRYSTTEAGAQPGDLVVWKDGHHIGIYVGPNRVVSALNENLGTRLTDLKIPEPPSQFLHINWGTNDGGGDNGGGDNGGGDNGGGDNGGTGNGNSGGSTGTGGGDNPTPAPTDAPTAGPTQDTTGSSASNGSTGFATPVPDPTDAPTPKPTPRPTDQPTPPPTADTSGDGSGQAISESVSGTLPSATRTNPQPTGSNGVAIATVNLRESPDATSRILGWVGSGGYVTIVGTAFSPEGNLYYKVTTATGASGWVYSHWVLRTQ